MRKLHPMYRDPQSLPDHEKRWLRQGDIIGLHELIGSGALDGHQEYIKQRPEFFCGFCVITQTCDLVRETKDDLRGEKRKPQWPVEFIALAMIRRLSNILNKNDVVNSDTRAKTRNLLREIVNHNENRRSYFYLHEEAAGSIGDDWVVDLRTFFSLVSDYHYDQILDARLLCLDDVFANKLGWMAGHMFSRVPTRGWDDFGMERKQGEFIEELLARFDKVEPKELHENRNKIVGILKKTSQLNRLSEGQLAELLEIAHQRFNLEPSK